jgi:predicted metal-dependent HD superfamily phosphohydrolase
LIYFDTEITQISIDILDTKHKDVPETEEGKCMVDADISGFTLSIDDVWADSVKLFSESGTNMIAFSRCIRAFLQTLLVRPSIYQSAYMTEQEAIARENISEIVERSDAVISKR